MADELQVSSSTDTQATVAAVANGEDGRAPVDESSLSEFTQSADGRTVTYESPQSERQSLLERLSQAEAEISLPVEQAEDGPAVDESGFSGEELKLIRETALQNALQDAQKIYRQPTYCDQEQQQQPQAELNRMVEQFNQGMQQIRQRNPEEYAEVYKNAEKEPIPSPVVVEALVGLGATEAAYFLMSHPDEARKLRQLPDSVAVARIGQLQAQLSPAARRQRSNAPLPISPVGGSSTKSSVPMDQLDYQTFSRLRQQQEKNRYRGR